MNYNKTAQIDDVEKFVFLSSYTDHTVKPCKLLEHLIYARPKIRYGTSEKASNIHIIQFLIKKFVFAK